MREIPGIIIKIWKMYYKTQTGEVEPKGSPAFPRIPLGFPYLSLGPEMEQSLQLSFVSFWSHRWNTVFYLCCS